MSNDIVKFKEEINKQLADKDTLNTLIATTFKGLDAPMVKRAALEGMMRGFTFQDFLEKNVYAVPFKGAYSLVTSIDYARKIGMRSGIVGKSAPTFNEQNGKIISCTVTVQKLVKKHVGEFTATVYFDEYYKAGRNGYPSLWDTKPHTMIAKVAEMHALRMACPEELSQAYVEEEYQKLDVIEGVAVNMDEYRLRLEAAQDLDELKAIWASLPASAKKALSSTKDEIKGSFMINDVSEEPPVEMDELNAILNQPEPEKV